MQIFDVYVCYSNIGYDVVCSRITFDYCMLRCTEYLTSVFLINGEIGLTSVFLITVHCSIACSQSKARHHRQGLRRGAAVLPRRRRSGIAVGPSPHPRRFRRHRRRHKAVMAPAGQAVGLHRLRRREQQRRRTCRGSHIGPRPAA